MSSSKSIISVRPETDHRNESNRAHFSSKALSRPFGQGSFRVAALGKYTQGPRKGRACVGKWFITGHVHESVYFDHDMRAVEKAAQIVTIFNSKNYVRGGIRVNIPQVWEFARQGRQMPARRILVEPYLRGFEKWNSNARPAGNTRSEWWPIMQALSHFSYHATGGRYVLCDLQGGFADGVLTLTDPVILSLNGGKRFGSTDLGPDGMVNFFLRHQCNRYCQSHWKLPKGCCKTIQRAPHISMSTVTVSATGGASASGSASTRRVTDRRTSRH